MSQKTFHGGVSLPEHKEFTVDKKIRVVPAPSEIILPISQHIGSPNKPLVKEGDNVKLGQCLARSAAFIASPVHSPVSGRVKAIKDFLNPIYGKRAAFVIENDGKDTPESTVAQGENEKDKKDVLKLSGNEIIETVKNAGIVGFGGAAFPTYVKLSLPEGKRVDTLIVNGAECEPYLTCDHRLMVEKTSEIIKGIHLAAKALEVKNIILAIEENKLSAVFAMEKAVRDFSKKEPERTIKIVILKTKYPQGGEKQLIKAILKKETPPLKLPLDVGVIVQNVGTCFAIYEAVYKNKPVMERCVTFTGSCLRGPGNFLVRLGTTVKDVVDYCGGFTEKPAKMIIGGPMMGVAQYTLDIPIIKGVTGAIFLSKKELEIFEESPCIRCAKCIDLCPVNLVPTDIMRMIKYSRWHYLDELHPVDCIECGSCAYACPARIPLVQYVKLAKTKQLEKK